MKKFNITCELFSTYNISILASSEVEAKTKLQEKIDNLDVGNLNDTNIINIKIEKALQ